MVARAPYEEPHPGFARIDKPGGLSHPGAEWALLSGSKHFLEIQWNK